MQPRVRFDDLSHVSARSFELSECVGELVAHGLGEVREVLAAVEEAAAAGHWCAGYVAYEASPAFDPVLQVRSRTGEDSPNGLPLAWFGVYEKYAECPPPDQLMVDPSLYRLSQWEPTVTEEEYRSAIAEIHRAIRRGDTYQVNHTFRMHASFSGDAFAFYRDLVVAQNGAYGAFLDLGRFKVLSASPERFFRVSGDRIDVRPMKGTIRRGRWPAEDHQLAEELRASIKNRAENVMIVDLLRNDLGRIAEFGSVRVEELFALERYRTLWQLTSQIAARLKPRRTLLDIFDGLFPSGSVTGAPKTSSMGIVSQLESTPRGVYCGAIGYVAPVGHSAGTHFSVAIRTAVIDQRHGVAEYGTGGGITWDSTYGSEYEEARLKTRLLQVAGEGFDLLETMRWDGGSYLFLERHLDRLRDSATYFGFVHDEAALRRRLADHGAALDRDSAMVRLVLQPEGTFAVTTTNVELLPFVDSAADLMEGTDEVLVALDESSVMSTDVTLFHKTTARGRYESARNRFPGVADVLLSNERGEVTESTVANLVVRLGSDWITPSLDSGCLPGSYRQDLLARGVITEGVVYASQLRDVDEMVLINSVRGWRRAVLDKAPFDTH